MKKTKSILLVVIPFLFLGFVLYMMFHENYKQILGQLGNADPVFLLLMAGIGICYELLDAWIMGKLILPKINKLKFYEMVQLIFLGVFMNITTFGTGIKPAQTYCVAQKGENPGRAFGLFTLPYVYHKTAIVVYATLMLVFQNHFLSGLYEDTFHYLLAGYVLSVMIILGLIVVCASKKFSGLVCRILDRLLKKDVWQVKKERIKTSLCCLQQESNDVIRDKKTWFWMILLNLIKMSCWYVLPLAALYAVGGEVNRVTLLQVVATASFMQLLIGVIPTAGGMVSTEVVYVLLFSRLFGAAAAGSTMILFRIATYYLPFLISIPVVFTMKMYRRPKKC